MAKASKTEINKRIGEVAEMLIECKNRQNIVLYSSEKWSIGERQTDKYIAKARELILEEITKDLEYDYAIAIKRYEDLYRKALIKEDYRLALSINKEISTLQGVHKIKIEHSGNVLFISNIPD